MISTPVWDNLEKTAIYTRYEGAWTWGEYHRTVALGQALMDEVDHPVSLIIHIADHAAAKPPSGAFSQWRKSMEGPGSVNQIILVSEIRIVRIIATISQRILNPDKARKVYAVDTLEAARALIKQQNSAGF